MVFRLREEAWSSVRVTPEAQVQGRALDMAEACSGGGVPCNAVRLVTSAVKVELLIVLQLLFEDAE